MKYQTLKGFRDILPEEMRIREEIISKTKKIVEKYGFLPLDTPVLEQADLLLGKYGTEEKLIYKFKDQGGREIALRYDLTVSLARVIENYKNQLNFPFKRYQIGQVWRAEKPQKGRYREFVTFDIDIVGSAAPIADAEIITIMSEWLESFGLKFQIKINDRRILNAAAKKIGSDKKETKIIFTAIDKLDKIGFEGVKKELQKIQKGEKLIDYLKIKNNDFQAVEEFIDSPDFSKNLKEVIRQAKKLGAKNIVFDPRIVRGLDYYTSTIFEAIVSGYEEFGSVVGGGRFDKMISELAQGDYPAVGTGFGVDRIFEVLKAAGKIKPKTKNVQIAILNIEENLIDDYLDIAKKLREKNIPCEIFYKSEKLSKQLSRANRLKFPYVLIYGKDEKKTGKYTIKNMQTGKQETCSTIKDIIKIVKK